MLRHLLAQLRHCNSEGIGDLYLGLYFFSLSLSSKVEKSAELFYAAAVGVFAEYIPDGFYMVPAIGIFLFYILNVQ